MKLLRKMLTVTAWLLILTIPLIEVGGLLISHGAISRFTIAVVLYITGLGFGFTLGYVVGGENNERSDISDS